MESNLEDICKRNERTEATGGKKIVFMTNEEYEKVIDVLRNTPLPQHSLKLTKEADEAAYRIVRKIGITPSELANLNFNDFVIEKDKIIYLRIINKKQERKISVDKLTSDCIINYIVTYNRENNQPSFQEGRLFRNENKNYRIYLRSLNRRLKRYARKAGLERWNCFSLISLRYTFAKEQIEQGAGIKELQELLGINEVRAGELRKLLR